MQTQQEKKWLPLPDVTKWGNDDRTWQSKIWDHSRKVMPQGLRLRQKDKASADA